MRPTRLKRMLACAIILSLNYAQFAPCFADARKNSDARKNKVPVAFVGIKFDDLDADTRKRVYDRIYETMKSESSLQVLAPEDVQRLVGAEKISALFAQPDSAAFRSLAEQLQVRFVIAGSLANQSRDPKRVLLVGELRRFDAATSLFHRFEVLKYYENFGVEVLKFKEEYVKTMLPNNAEGKGPWGLVLLVGIAVAGVVALTASFVKAGGSEGGTGDSGPKP